MLRTIDFSGWTLSKLHDKALQLSTDESSIRWQRAWLLATTETEYGDDAYVSMMEALSERHGLSLDRMKQECWMGKSYTPDQVVEGMSYSHHRAVKKMPPEERQEALETARDLELTVAELSEWYKENYTCNSEPEEELPFADPLDFDDMHAYARRIVAERCPDVSKLNQDLVCSAYKAGLQSWEDAQVREVAGVMEPLTAEEVLI